MIVLMSIKPQYAEKILNGSKKYEFRKFRFARDANIVMIYATSPVRRVVGEFRIRKIIEAHPKALWQMYGIFSDMTEREFSKYFYDRKRGCAIQIGEVVKYEHQFELSEIFGQFKPPRTWCYVQKNYFKNNFGLSLREDE